MSMKSRTGGLILRSMVGLLADGCGDDGKQPPFGLGPLDAALDAALDAGHPSGDASSEPSQADAQAVCSPIDQPYDFYYEGGLVETHYSSEVTPEGIYRRLRTMGTVVTSCTATLPVCGSAGVDRGELHAALSNPEVTAALDTGTTTSDTVYGTDSRPVDGQVFVVARGFGNRFAVGGPCSAACGGACNSCREIPAGLDALVALLKQLDEEQSASGPCAGF